MSETRLAGILVLAAALAALASLITGPANLFTVDPSLALTILFEIRLPRAALGLLVGGVLALGGAALQGLLRNPLASPRYFGELHRVRPSAPSLPLIFSASAERSAWPRAAWQVPSARSSSSWHSPVGEPEPQR